MFDFSAKLIIVTGGTELLGRKIVKKMHSSGAIVICGDVNIDKSDSFSRIIDITDKDSLRKFILEIINEYGKIDRWINNAYLLTADCGNKFMDILFQLWRKNVNMQLNGFFICCKLTLEQMKTQNSGSLINMSSIYGVVGPDFTVYNETEIIVPAAYTAIKGGITTLTNYLASYLCQYNIRVNALSAEGIFDNQPIKFVENYNKKVPARRMGKPEDISAAVHFLLTDEASCINGHNLVVNGGWTAI